MEKNDNKRNRKRYSQNKKSAKFILKLITGKRIFKIEREYLI